MIARWIKWIIAFIILSIAVLLPYKLRNRFSDWFGRFINYFYHSYIRLLRWFFEQLEDKK